MVGDFYVYLSDELLPVPLDELRNVWGFHLLFGKDLLNLQIVQTEVTANVLHLTKPFD
mgnify:CR=1 FL=1